MIKYLLTESGQAGRANIWPSGPPTQSISTYSESSDSFSQLKIQKPW